MLKVGKLYRARRTVGHPSSRIQEGDVVLCVSIEKKEKKIIVRKDGGSIMEYVINLLLPNGRTIGFVTMTEGNVEHYFEEARKR